MADFEKLVESELEELHGSKLRESALKAHPDMEFVKFHEGKAVLSDGVEAVLYESEDKQEKYSIATLVENEDYDKLAELNEGALAKKLASLGGQLGVGASALTILSQLAFVGASASLLTIPIIGVGVGVLGGYGVGKGLEGVGKLFTHSTLRRTMKDLQDLVVKRDALVAEIGQAEDQKQAERERKSEIQSLTTAIKQKGTELNREVERMGGIDALDVSAKQGRKIQDFLNAAEDGALTGFPKK